MPGARLYSAFGGLAMTTPKINFDKVLSLPYEGIFYDVLGQMQAIVRNDNVRKIKSDRVLSTDGQGASSGVTVRWIQASC